MSYHKYDFILELESLPNGSLIRHGMFVKIFREQLTREQLTI